MEAVANATAERLHGHLRMGPGGVVREIQSAYLELEWGSVFRETIKNAEEADADWFLIDYDRTVHEQEHVYRLVMVDNGHGFTGDTWAEHFGRELRHTSKDTGALHGNFGIGARISMLPMNPAGVLTVTKTVGEGIRAFKIWLEGEIYEWEQIDPTEAHHNHLAEYYLGEEESGTIFVFFGQTGEDDTYWGDLRKSKSVAAFARRFLVGETSLIYKPVWDYIERRFENPEIEIRFARPDGSVRRPKGAGEHLREKSTAFGTVDVGEYGQVDWFLDMRENEDGSRPRAFSDGLNTSMAGVYVRYDDELYPLSDAEYSTFGIALRKIRNRVAIIVEPTMKSQYGGGHCAVAVSNTLGLRRQGR